MDKEGVVHTHTHTHTHTKGYCLTIKKNEFFAVCNNMDRGIMFSEISQKEKISTA